MEPTFVIVEPARVNSLIKWWSSPEAATLLDCLDKSRSIALIAAADLQTKATVANGNQNFNDSAEEKMLEAAQFETAIKVLKSFFPDGPFIARIEL